MLPLFAKNSEPIVAGYVFFAALLFCLLYSFHCYADSQEVVKDSAQYQAKIHLVEGIFYSGLEKSAIIFLESEKRRSHSTIFVSQNTAFVYEKSQLNEVSIVHLDARMPKIVAEQKTVKKHKKIAQGEEEKQASKTDNFSKSPFHEPFSFGANQACGVFVIPKAQDLNGAAFYGNISHHFFTPLKVKKNSKPLVFPDTQKYGYCLLSSFRSRPPPLC